MRNIFLFLILLVALYYVSDGFWKPLLNGGRTAPEPSPPPTSVPALDQRKNQGEVVQYYDNGTIKAQRQFKDGKLDGAYKLYHENGQLKLEGSYRNDQMQGVFKRYNSRGQLLSEEVYEDNVLVSRKVHQP